MMRYPFLAVVLILSFAPAHAITVVYDSLSGYTPGADQSWLNGDLEQGIRIARTDVDQRLTKAEFFFRNGFVEPLTTSTKLRFYADQNGVPGDLLATVDDSFSVGVLSVEQVSVDLPSLLLPNDPIWVTWVFGSSRNSGGVTLGGVASIGSDYATRAYKNSPGDAWTIDAPFGRFGGGPPLRLSAVPEPTGILLGVSSLALLALTRRRQS